MIVHGERTNLKVTEPTDLILAAALLDGVMEVRVGQGFDVHPFVDDPERTLVLGGVRFDDARPLAGHSDADAVAHACADALLGAAGLGDIGTLFPDTDPAWAGADSLRLLGEVSRRVRAEGWTPGNVDCSVVTDEPQLAPDSEP